MDWNSPRVSRCAGTASLLTLVLFFWSTRAIAQPEPRDQIRVATLIKQLGDHDFNARRSAFQRLAKIGSAGREQLEQALADADPEVRLRAGQLLESLKLDEIWAPSLVNLEAQQLSATDIMQRLSEQTGNRIHVGDPYGTFADAKLDVKFVGTSYWQALDEVCRRTNNRVRPHYDMHTPGVVVSSGSPGKYPRAYSGPVRAQIMNAKRYFVEELNYEEGKSELTHSFHINLQFNWEDRFGIVGYATQPELVEGVTDNHVILSAAQPTGGGWNATSRGLRQVTASLKLNPIPVSAQALETFTIRWGLIAVGEPAVMETTDFELDKPHVQDDVVMRLDSIEEPTAGRYVVTVYILRDLAMPDPHEVVFREYDLELIDQAGQPFRVQNQTPSLTERGVQLRITFHGDSAESKAQTLRLHYPRLRSKRDVHLTFKNVPLPVAKPE